MSEMPKQVFRAAIAAVVIAAAALVLYASGGPVQANHDVEVGVDLVTTGNTAESIGANPIDTCRVVSPATQFDIDIYIKRVSSLIATSLDFQYDPAKIQVVSKQILFQSAQAGSSVSDASSGVVSPGVYNVGAAETAQTSGDTGEGVLFRLTLQAIGSGTSPAKLSKIDIDNDGTADRGITLRDSNALNIADTADADPFFDTPPGAVVNSVIVIGAGSCVSGDADGDGVPDLTDNCPSVANPGQADWNFDGLGDACQDFDGDGILDANDNCKGIANANQADMDGDGLGDVCDPDRDGDTVANTTDNCPDIANANQTDMDGDGKGDVCDDDRDGDFFINNTETFVTTNPDLKCGFNAFPPDMNSDTNINIIDVGALRPVFNSVPGDGRYNKRQDMNADSRVNILDVGIFRPYFLKNCNNI